MDSISIREAADRLGVSHKVIRRLISQGTLEAYKHPGPHGVEWRVGVASLMAYQGGQAAPRHSTSSRVRLASPQSQAAHSDERPAPAAAPLEQGFLQQHIERLTDLLACAMKLTDAGLPPIEPPTPVPVDGVPETVTASLQAALRSARQEGVCSLEMCSIKALWGRPVLWRVVAEDQADIGALLDALLDPDAAWTPPGEEITFIWAFGAQRDALWGTACGAGWFGPAFEEVLRNCRVERR